MVYACVAFYILIHRVSLSFASINLDIGWSKYHGYFSHGRKRNWSIEAVSNEDPATVLSVSMRADRWDLWMSCARFFWVFAVRDDAGKGLSVSHLELRMSLF
jgi:hypothetical protein